MEKEIRHCVRCVIDNPVRINDIFGYISGRWSAEFMGVNIGFQNFTKEIIEKFLDHLPDMYSKNIKLIYANNCCKPKFEGYFILYRTYPEFLSGMENIKKMTISERQKFYIDMDNNYYKIEREIFCMGLEYITFADKFSDSSIEQMFNNELKFMLTIMEIDWERNSERKVLKPGKNNI